jgi:hypothetical protein
VGPVDARAILRPALRVDRLGDERVVLDADAGVVHTLRGEAATSLDAVVRGEAVQNGEVLLALVRAGIVQQSGVSRRDLLGVSGLVSALLLTTVLPSAAAAASGGGGGSGGGAIASVVGTSTLVTEYAMTDNGVAFQLFRIAHQDFASSGATLVREFTLSQRRTVYFVLVGGGGGGGNIDTSNVGFRTGGGGAGYVHDAGHAADAGATILVTVGARAIPGTAGNTTRIDVDGEIFEAPGGGRGAGNGTEASYPLSGFGSGGGGRSSADGVDADRDGAFDGGDGGSQDAGGGGGAALAVEGGDGGNGTSDGGGAGGAGVDIASLLGTWDGVGANPLLHRYVAGGGGGGGLTVGGAGGAAGGVTVGGIGVSRGDVTASGNARHGAFATGSGGGGGAADGIESAAGAGASGVAWILVQIPPES